jgi:hypothetical protein
MPNPNLLSLVIGRLMGRSSGVSDNRPSTTKAGDKGSKPAAKAGAEKGSKPS